MACLRAHEAGQGKDQTDDRNYNHSFHEGRRSGDILETSSAVSAVEGGGQRVPEMK